MEALGLSGTQQDIPQATWRKNARSDTSEVYQELIL
jgi:hypothetical protein